MTDPITPQQADREAVALVAEWMTNNALIAGNDIAAIRNGIWDSSTVDIGALLQILAHHAQQARLEERDRCAAYMDTRGQKLFDEATNKSTGHMMRTIYAAEAATIRKGEAHDL